MRKLRLSTSCAGVGVGVGAGAGVNQQSDEGKDGHLRLLYPLWRSGSPDPFLSPNPFLPFEPFIPVPTSARLCSALIFGTTTNSRLNGSKLDRRGHT